MSSPIKLESITQEGRVELAILESGIVSIGRDTENGLVVDSESVSRRHGIIQEAGSQWVFRDLESTNGSWLNNVKVKPEQVKLLRDGDRLRLADFLLAITEIPVAGKDSSDLIPSVLVFANDRFEAEAQLTADQSRFSIGGERCDFVLEGIPDEEMLIKRVADRLEVTVMPGSSAIMVNSMAVGGTTALSDRDEISVLGYRFVISNPLAVVKKDSVDDLQWLRRAKDGGIGEATATARAGMSSYLGAGQFKEWESEGSRRRSQVAKRFVFGTPVAEFDPAGTVAVPRVSPYNSRSGYEMHPSSRFSGQGMNESAGLTPGDRILLAAGLILIVLFIIVILVSSTIL